MLLQKRADGETTKFVLCWKSNSMAARLIHFRSQPRRPELESILRSGSLSLTHWGGISHASSFKILCRLAGAAYYLSSYICKVLRCFLVTYYKYLDIQL